MSAERRPIYLDYHATTPLDPRVRQAMDRVLDAGPANPHAASHAYGWRAAAALDKARGQVAALIGARPEEVIFTSGATEANNLAILGHMAARADGRRHVLVSPIEHACVEGACGHLLAQGCEVTVLPVGRDGLIDPEAFAAAIRPDTALASIMLANNEIGTLQPLAELGVLCRARGVTLHSDGAQAAGKLPLDLAALPLDLMSLSAHKMYGPMGIGALYLRPGTALAPRLFGGEQERGLRPGTVPLPLAVGFGAAAELAMAELPAEMPRVAALRDRLLAGLRKQLPDLRVNGTLAQRLAGNLNLRCPGLNAEDWLLACPDLALSTGSACASGDQTPSQVLAAIGLTPQEITESIRIGIGRFTAEAEIEAAIESLVRGAQEARAKAAVA